MHHANILGYFFQAGIVVKTVMLILLAASLLSWTLILQRGWFFKRIKRSSEAFLADFWQSEDLSTLYKEIDENPQQEGLVSVFYAGFKEYLRRRKNPQQKIESIQRVMEIAETREMIELEQHLSLFSAIGSITPYIGLFGTVWGIMSSLQALGNAQQATIAMVAPGISEALVATALGLFTAIPAVIAYNRFSTRLGQLRDQYQLFQEEFIALIEQQDGAGPGEGHA